MIRILLVDDQNLVRQGLKLLLESKSELEIVGTAEDGYQAIDRVKTLSPDVVLIDIEMPKMDGVSATRQICKLFPATKVIILSSYENEEYVTQALQAGAKGYLLKSSLSEDLEQAIRSVYFKNFNLEPKLTEKIIGGTFVCDRSTLDSSASTSSQETWLLVETSHNDKEDSNTKRLPIQTQEISAAETSVSENSNLKFQPKKQLFPERSKAFKEKHKSKLRFLLPLGVLAFGASIAVGYYFSLSPSKIKLIELSGRIEGYETKVAAKEPGRVEFVAVREGDRIQQNQVIVRLDDDELQADLEGAKARSRAAKQQERQALLQIDVLKSRIGQVQLNLQQSKVDAEGEIAEAEANVAAAQAQLAEVQAQFNEAKVNLKLAQIELNRHTQLLKEEVVTQQTFDRVRTDFEAAKAMLNLREASITAAQKQVNAAQGSLEKAKATSFNSDIYTAELKTMQKQLIQLHSRLEAARDEVVSVSAAQRKIEAQIDDLNIVSPINGVVVTRSVEPGEVVTNGEVLLSLINLNNVYLRGYIPEGDIGKVRVGQRARIFIDSAPERPLSARVIVIDDQASFTPENIYFREDRVKQVFGVKISIDNPSGFVKPGMSADGEIVIDEVEKR